MLCFKIVPVVIIIIIVITVEPDISTLPTQPINVDISISRMFIIRSANKNRENLLGAQMVGLVLTIANDGNLLTPD